MLFKNTRVRLKKRLKSPEVITSRVLGLSAADGRRVDHSPWHRFSAHLGGHFVGGNLGFAVRDACPVTEDRSHQGSFVFSDDCFPGLKHLVNHHWTEENQEIVCETLCLFFDLHGSDRPKAERWNHPTVLGDLSEPRVLLKGSTVLSDICTQNTLWVVVSSAPADRTPTLEYRARSQLV